MIDRVIIDELFAKVRACESVNDLYEYKMNLHVQAGELHSKLHEMKRDVWNLREPMDSKADVINLIKLTDTLLEFMKERLEIVRQMEYHRMKDERVRKAQERELEKNIQVEDYQLKKKFYWAAKKMLKAGTLQIIESVAESSKTMKEIKEMPEAALE